MISPDDIRRAALATEGRVYRTPLLRSHSLSAMSGADVYIKCENLQKTGSFKVRGAFNVLLNMSGTNRVVAASMGNHAQAVALAATELGMSALIFMPEGASIAKQLAVRGYGGTVRLLGRDLGEALAAAHAEGGHAFVHPYDNPLVMAGQGTAGLEILEQLEDFDEVIVPVGGGGLISGIAAAIKGSGHRSRITGVQSTAALSACRSVEAGSQVTCAPGATIADGIAVGTVGERCLETINQFVDEMGAVDDDATAEAIMMFMERKRMLVEGAGAVPLAWLLANAERYRGRKVVLVASGGNIDITLIERILHRGMLSAGRVVTIDVIVDDRPGSLHLLTGIIAREKGNVLSIQHDRIAARVPIGKTRTVFVIETMDAEHGQRIMDALRAGGVEVTQKGAGPGSVTPSTLG